MGWLNNLTDGQFGWLLIIVFIVTVGGGSALTVRLLHRFGSRAVAPILAVMVVAGVVVAMLSRRLT